MAEAELEDTARIARDLIRFETVNWGGGKSNGETDAAEYIAAELTRLGLSPQLFESEPGRTSLVARVEGADPSRPALVLHGHLDVVPADGGRLERRSVRRRDPRRDAVGPRRRRHEGHGRHDPDRARRHPGRGGAAGARPDRRVLRRRGERRRLRLALVVDNHPELFAGATEAISEVGGYSIDVGGQRAYLLQTGEKALVWIKLTARGTTAHGSRVIPDNAVTKLAARRARDRRARVAGAADEHDDGAARASCGRCSDRTVGDDPDVRGRGDRARLPDSCARRCASPRTRRRSTRATSTT